jgi:mono/diheme cytochrome c family protein
MNRGAACVALLACAMTAWADDLRAPDAAQIARGRYLVQIGGCNDCHTVGYVAAGGHLSEAQSLKGSPQGYTGPWGTTYAPNLRAALAPLSERDWLAIARLPRQPPMPWTSLQAMSDADLRAVYRFVRSLDGGLHRDSQRPR